MSTMPLPQESHNIASTDAAPQHRPRPLPLFLDLLRSETATSPDRMKAALAGLRAYQQAQRPPRPPEMPIVARAGRAAVRDYGGCGRPVLFIPSLINPPYVLDVAENNSLLRWLSSQGVRPLLVDWGSPSATDRVLSFAGHVETLLLPLIAELGEDIVLAGYCLGGTMALAAAARRQVSGLTLMAAPWRFDGFPSLSREELCQLWTHTRATAEALGVFPMEALQSSFWRLDPRRTVAKFEMFGTLSPGSPEANSFVALEDWANDGPPLTLAAARELFEDFFGGDLPGSNRWWVSGAPVDPGTISCPVLDIVSASDRIVPAASAAAIGDRLLLQLGHVGMIVGGRARTSLWQPLSDWLSRIGDS
jgi:polyhydroxyalkanoate synthase